MTEAELDAHRQPVESWGFDDGYTRMDRAYRFGWRAIAGWGKDGWDLGSWPYVVKYVRHKDGVYDLAEDVEGDIYRWSFATQERLEAAIDRLALWHWLREDADWARGSDIDNPSDHLRGPYRHRR